MGQEVLVSVISTKDDRLGLQLAREKESNSVEVFTKNVGFLQGFECVWLECTWFLHGFGMVLAWKLRFSCSEDGFLEGEVAWERPRFEPGLGGGCLDARPSGAAALMAS